MNVNITYQLPEDEAELRAALDSLEVLGKMREFREELRSWEKHGTSLKTSEDAVAHCYWAFCDRFSPYLDR